MLKSVIVVSSLLAVILACAGTQVHVDPKTGEIHIIGPGPAEVHATGLEDAKSQIIANIEELQAMSPPNDEWIDAWHGHLAKVIEYKGEGSRPPADAEGGEAEQGGKAP